MIVRAGRSDGEEGVAASHEQCIFTVDLADEHRAIGKLGKGNAGSEIALRSLFHRIRPVLVRHGGRVR